MREFYANKLPNCECALCHKKFYRKPCEQIDGPMFCGKECYGISIRKVKFCANCGIEIFAHKSKRHSWKNAKYCSRACANTGRKGIRYTDERLKDKSIQIKNLRISVALKYGGTCANCGNTNFAILDVHHKIHKAKGGTDDLDNLILLCRNCHGSEHKGTFTFEEYLQKSDEIHRQGAERHRLKIEKRRLKEQNRLERERHAEIHRIELEAQRRIKELQPKQSRKQHPIIEEHPCICCGKPTTNKQFCSHDCAHKNTHKFEVSKEELESLIKQYPMSAIAKKFGVSANAVKKRAINLGIIIPKRLGFWAKLKANKIHKHKPLFE